MERGSDALSPLSSLELRNSQTLPNSLSDLRTIMPLGRNPNTFTRPICVVDCCWPLPSATVRAPLQYNTQPLVAALPAVVGTPDHSHGQSCCQG